MQKKFRILLGILILVITSGSAIAVGIFLPIQTIRINNEIDDKLHTYGQITEADLEPHTTPTDTNYSDFMYVDPEEENSNYYSQANFEFYNVSDRLAYLQRNNPISYIFVPGELVFDMYVKRIVVDYDPDENYLVYATRKSYIFNANKSDLSGNEKVLNFNYLWPYYLKHLGNGTEYGFQTYVASFMMKTELEDLNYNTTEIAKIILNKNYANAEDLIYSTRYNPHKWINTRPDYIDINFDESTAYKILYNAVADNGKDYSLFSGDAGSVKYFLDLIKGLDYDPTILTFDPEQKLADIYDIDTPIELQYAQSLAAYLTFLAYDPALNWLYDHKISYVCERTAMEWLLGIEDPLMGGKKYPLLHNESLNPDDFDVSQDLFYAVDAGLNNLTEVDKLLGIANIPNYENSQSYKVETADDFVYVVEGNRGFRIVDINDPLFRGIGGYRLQGYSFVDIALDSNLFGSYAYVAAKDNGVLQLDVTDPSEITQLQTWTNMDNINALDLEFIPTTTNLLVAMGEHGVAKVSTAGGSMSLSTAYQTESPVISVTTDSSKAYVVQEGRGIEVLDVANLESLSNESLATAKKAVVHGSNLFVLDDTQGLVVYDINGDNLDFLASYDFGTDGVFHNLYIEDNILYLAAGDTGLLAVSLDDIDNLVLSNLYDSDGTAYDAYIDGSDVYLADGSQGLVHLTYSLTANEFGDIIERDELRTYIEVWNKPSFVQFNSWPLNTEQFDTFNATYGINHFKPEAERGISQRWVEEFYRPFLWDSSRDTTLFYEDLVYIYLADTQQPYLQVDQYDLYWQEYADYLNNSFVHVGYWNKLHGTDWTNDDIYMTHTFPGSIQDEFHFQVINTEPITGTIVEKVERVQYNTYADQYLEYYPYLNQSEVSNPQTDIYKYSTWHQTYPKLTADMGTIFWKEDITRATENKVQEYHEEFLDELSIADTYRTGGAFGALFILTLGLITASMTINMNPIKEAFRKKKD